MLISGLFLLSISALYTFGACFDVAMMNGSDADDAFSMQNGKVITMTNHNGGINGGISNGMPVVFKTVVKPTPSIYQLQKSVNFKTMETVDIEIDGRHDPCIAHRVRVVVDSLSAFAIVDLMMSRFIELDWMGNGQ